MARLRLSIKPPPHDIADKWALPLYDMTMDLDICKENLLEFLPDGTRSTTHATRLLIAEHIAAWASQLHCPSNQSASWTLPAASFSSLLE